MGDCTGLDEIAEAGVREGEEGGTPQVAEEGGVVVGLVPVVAGDFVCTGEPEEFGSIFFFGELGESKSLRALFVRSFEQNRMLN